MLSKINRSLTNHGRDVYVKNTVITMDNSEIGDDYITILNDVGTMQIVLLGISEVVVY